MRTFWLSLYQCGLVNNTVHESGVRCTRMRYDLQMKKGILKLGSYNIYISGDLAAGVLCKQMAGSD